MDDRTLLKSQRNEIFPLVRGVGLEPADFQWSDIEPPDNSYLLVSQLMHVPTGSYIIFDYRSFRLSGGIEKQYRSCIRSPGQEEKVEYSGALLLWEMQKEYAGEWLTYVRREYEQPDLWEAATLERSLLITTGTGEDNSSFTEGELTVIDRALDETKQYLIETQDLPEHSAGPISRQLDYLKGAARRMGRLDWKGAAFSSLVGIAIDQALTGEASRALLRFAAQALGHVLGGAPLLGGY